MRYDKSLKDLILQDITTLDRIKQPINFPNKTDISQLKTVHYFQE